MWYAKFVFSSDVSEQRHGKVNILFQINFELSELKCIIWLLLLSSDFIEVIDLTILCSLN